MKNTSAAKRILEIKDTLIKHKSLAYIVPKNDAYLNTFLDQNRDNLFKVSNFTGSSGTAIIFSNAKNVLLTDSRYTL